MEKQNEKISLSDFEIVGVSANGIVPNYLKKEGYATYNNPFINRKPIYQRVFIRKKRDNKSEIIW